MDGEHHTDWVSTYAFTHLNKTKETQATCITSQGDLIIGNDVWIGDAATVMSGVKVGNGAAIGARSLVVKDVPAYAIVSGVPARFLKLRFTPQQIAALERIAWWVDEFIARYS